MITETRQDDVVLETQDKDEVFIACSSDLHTLRENTEMQIRKKIGHFGLSDELDVYSFDVDFASRGGSLDQRLSIQEHIPRPSNPRFRAVICLMSERVGIPLGDASKLLSSELLKEWAEVGLCHPWPTNPAKRSEALMNGQFPLTGTIFEFVESLSVNKPVFVAFIVSNGLSPNDPHAILGGAAYRTRASVMELNFDTWYKENYEPQTLAVRNFYAALQRRGRIAQVCARAEDVEYLATKFVVDIVLHRNRHLGVNPYRYLGYYDVNDREILAGRDDDTKVLVTQLINGFKPDNPAPMICIMGKSGSGKSSLLRAGVLAGLNDPELRSRYVTSQFRPADFPREEEAVMRVLEKILDLFSKCPGIVLDATDLVAFMQLAKEKRPAALVQIICKSLNPPSDTSQIYLVIGIDQFEEIVDDLASTQEKQRQWMPLIDFIHLGRATGRIGFALTLESSRKPTLPNIPLGPDVERALTEIKNDGIFWQRIIEKPFSKSGYPLHPEVINKLLMSFRAVQASGNFGNEDSLLPLLAVKLSRLFDHLTEVRPLKPKGDNIAEGDFDANLIGLKDIEPFRLDMEDEVSKTADEAFRSVIGDLTSTEEPLEELGHFLRPLIRVADTGGESLELRSILQPGYKKLRDLIDAFLSRKLIVRSGKYFRLVHEAVVRFWKPAREWLDESRPLLIVERQFRDDAFEWHNSGRPAENLKAGHIGNAAEILHQYSWTWSLTARLTRNHQLGRDYCLALLGLSETPRAPVGPTTKGITHTHLAAEYNCVSLLQKFKRLDSECLELAAISTGRSPLALAAWAAPDAVAYLIGEGCDAEKKDAKGWRPIYAPIIQNDQAIFQLLLPHYDVASLTDGPEGWTALHQCARENRISFAHTLIDEIGLEPSLLSAQHLSPLHVAAINGATEVFKYLLPLSDPNSRTKAHETPLIFAASGGHTEIVRALLNDSRVSTAEICAHDKDGMQAIHWAAYEVKPNVIDELARSVSVDVNAKIAGKNRYFASLSALHVAASNAEVEAVKALLRSASCDPNVRDKKKRTPLGLALFPDLQLRNQNASRANRAGREAVIELLLADTRLNPGLPIQLGGPTPLRIAAEQKLWTIFRQLNDRAISIDLRRRFDDDKTLLLLSVENDAPMFLVEILIKRDSEALNHFSKEGRSPLIQALETERGELVKCLLKAHKIKVDLKSETLGSALHIAARKGTPVDVLNRLWYTPLHVDKLGRTPLHLAAAAGHIETARWLIGKNPSLVNCTDNWGRKLEDLAARHLLQALGMHRSKRWPTANAGSWEQRLKWGRLAMADYKRVFEVCSGVIGEHDLLNRTEILSTPLPFYPKQVRLLSFSEPAWTQGLRLFALWYGGKTPFLLHLNGTSPHIHKMNKEVPPIINEFTVLDYLRFFCFFVRGDSGPFLIFESIAQPEITKSTSEKSRRGLELHSRPARSWGVDGFGKQRVSGTVYYGNAIFFADFLIHPHGMVEMVDDIPILANLPDVINAPIT